MAETFQLDPAVEKGRRRLERVPPVVAQLAPGVGNAGDGLGMAEKEKVTGVHGGGESIVQKALWKTMQVLISLEVKKTTKLRFLDQGSRPAEAFSNTCRFGTELAGEMVTMRR